MKILIAYVVWNKREAVQWLLNGIQKSFKSEQADVLFLLDNPIDGTDELFYSGKLDYYGFNVKFEVYFENPLKQFKLMLQNKALKYAKENGYDLVICPQDDQKLEDPYLYGSISDAISRYKNVGIIGGRDGFETLDFKDAVGSYFSIPTGDGYMYIVPGLTSLVRYLNDGPLIYTRAALDKDIYHDERYHAFYSELDYCRQCEAAGLSVVHLSMSVVHEKIGALQTNLYYQRYNYGELDSKLFHSKWS